MPRIDAAAPLLLRRLLGLEDGFFRDGRGKEKGAQRRLARLSPWQWRAQGRSCAEAESLALLRPQLQLEACPRLGRAGSGLRRRSRRLVAPSTPLAIPAHRARSGPARGLAVRHRLRKRLRDYGAGESGVKDAGDWPPVLHVHPLAVHVEPGNTRRVVTHASAISAEVLQRYRVSRARNEWARGEEESAPRPVDGKGGHGQTGGSAVARCRSHVARRGGRGRRRLRRGGLAQGQGHLLQDGLVPAHALPVRLLGQAEEEAARGPGGIGGRGQGQRSAGRRWARCVE
mmetsp:Transcript_10269/g.30443  ORF Transcript_10269/g.30443 Transcript_10269/m.30443 type:complete len:286 (-) Transcript_10269:1052-1909(-)